MDNEINALVDKELEVIKKIVSYHLKGLKYRVPKGFWYKSSAYKAVRYVILDVFKYSKDDIKKSFTVTSLDLLGLRSVRRFGDMYDLLSNAVPEFELHPWEFKKLPDKFWTNNNIKEAIMWLIYEVEDTIPINFNLTPKLLYDNGLSKIYSKCHHSTREIMNIVFPEEYFGKI